MIGGLPAERPGTPAPDALAETRAAIAAAPPIWPAHPRADRQIRARNGVACLEMTARQACRTILYLHGGGYRLGRASEWAGFAGELADRAAARVVLPEYRLAPEHPFPAALHDVAAVVETLIAEGEPFIIAGDSAGGGLAAAATLAMQAKGQPKPRAVILLSPWLDLTLSARSFETNAACDRFFPRANATDAAAHYLQGHPATDPLVSPLFADLQDFPPSLVLAGGDETLWDDATRFAESLARAGAEVESHFVADMQHIWPVIFPDIPETAVAMEKIARFAARAI